MVDAPYDRILLACVLAWLAAAVVVETLYPGEWDE